MRSVIVFLLVVKILFSPLVVSAQDASGLASGAFNSDVVAEASLGGLEDCIEYCITGICIWLICSIYECHLEYTAQVAHNLPDLVVSAYPLPGEISYEESKAVYGEASVSIMEAQFGFLGEFLVGGGDQLSSVEQREGGSEGNRRKVPDITLKEINIVGSPFIEEVSEYAEDLTGGYICSSAVEPLDWFYGSEIDSIAWRLGLTELFYPQTYNPFSNVIGNLVTNYWGRIYPRQGFLHQRNDAKAAAVMASRAMHVTTRDEQPHIYSRPHIMGSHEVSSRRWQVIAPNTDNFCQVFGENVFYGNNPEQKSWDEKYGYIYWGRHECCADNPGIPLGEIDIDPICL